MNGAKMKFQNNQIKYIGYYKMLEYIVEHIGDYSYTNRLVLIDKYIEIMKLILELEKSDT